MKPDQERIKTLLADTVTLLCRNGLHFRQQLRVQGVLGITVDDSDVFIVHINESFTEQVRGAKLADFPGPLGAGFTASLVASLSGNIGQLSASAAGDLTGNLASAPVNSGAVIQPPSLSNRQHIGSKHKSDIDQGTVKHPRQEVQSPGDDSQEIKPIVVVPSSVALGNVAIEGPWQFSAAEKPTEPASETAAAACYLGGSAAPAAKRKANVYPPQSMLAMSLGGIASTVDYGSAVLHAAGPSAGSEPLTQPGGKLWIDSGQNLVAAQQQPVKSEDQRLSTAVFDPITGCATWTVQHLIDSQHLHGHTDDQQHPNLEVQIHELNPLGMLAYAPSESADSGRVVGTETVTAAHRRLRSKESRRSWTSKHKPYACRHPGCRRSYFFVHDLRRHLRQKHAGMDYNEQSGQYEVAVTDDPPAGDSPPSVHDDSDDQSPDTDDEVSIATANLVG